MDWEQGWKLTTVFICFLKPLGKWKCHIFHIVGKLGKKTKKSILDMRLRSCQRTKWNSQIGTGLKK